MPKDNEADEKVVAMMCLVPSKRYPHFAGVEVQLYGGYEPRIGDEFYSAATVADLRAEVERLREANHLYSFAMNTAGIDELKRRADAAERRVGELIEIIARVARCSYSVCTQIDLRGRRWSEAYLDQVLPDILATLTGADPT